MLPHVGAVRAAASLLDVGPWGYRIAFLAMQRAGAEAVDVLADDTLIGARGQIIALAAEHHLPAMYFERGHIEDGGLISYGQTLPR